MLEARRYYCRSQHFRSWLIVIQMLIPIRYLTAKPTSLNIECIGCRSAAAIVLHAKARPKDGSFQPFSAETQSPKATFWTFSATMRPVHSMCASAKLLLFTLLFCSPSQALRLEVTAASISNSDDVGESLSPELSQPPLWSSESTPPERPSGQPALAPGAARRHQAPDLPTARPAAAAAATARRPLLSF